VRFPKSQRRKGFPIGVHAVVTTPAQRLGVLLRSFTPSRVSLPRKGCRVSAVHGVGPHHEMDSYLKVFDQMLNYDFDVLVLDITAIRLPGTTPRSSKTT
jgi:hypothetical protein